jgi:hypothetical protein
VPAGVTTEIGPVVAPSGTVAVIFVSESTVKTEAVPLNRTAVAPEKAEPLIVTDVPTGPDVGENPLIDGGGITEKVEELVAVPPGVTTEIAPLVAPFGTVAVIFVSESTEKIVVVPLNRTSVAPLSCVPVIVTDVPTEPDAGENPPIDGAGTVTVKLAELEAVPSGVTTEIGPLVAPSGTVAVIRVFESSVNEALGR